MKDEPGKSIKFRKRGLLDTWMGILLGRGICIFLADRTWCRIEGLRTTLINKTQEAVDAEQK